MSRRAAIKDIILISITLCSLGFVAFKYFYKERPGELPRYLAMLPGVSADDYEIVHQSNDVTVLYFEEDASYSVVYQKDKLIAMFSGNSRHITSFDPEGNSVGFPVSNKSHKNMRYIDNNKDPSHKLIDYDSDGFPDIKIERGRGKYYIYRHGFFEEITKDSHQKTNKVLMNGDAVYFKNGKWHKTPNENSEP